MIFNQLNLPTAGILGSKPDWNPALQAPEQSAGPTSAECDRGGAQGTGAETNPMAPNRKHIWLQLQKEGDTEEGKTGLWSLDRQEQLDWRGELDAHISSGSKHLNLMYTLLRTLIQHNENKRSHQLCADETRALATSGSLQGVYK